jgi:hypothetical protein
MSRSTTAERVANRFIGAKVHSSPEAMKRYLQKHPKANPRNHTVKGPAKGDDKGPAKGDGDKKDVSKEKGFESLKDVPHKERQEAIQKALLNVESEKDELKGKNKGKAPAKDNSKEKGFESLKGLSPEAQRKLIQKALGDKDSKKAFEAVLALDDNSQ